MAPSGNFDSYVLSIGFRTEMSMVKLQVPDALVSTKRFKLDAWLVGVDNFSSIWKVTQRGSELEENLVDELPHLRPNLGLYDQRCLECQE